MKTIDIHTHAWTDELARKALPALLARAENRLTAHYDGTVAGLLTQMDSSGVDISVIQPVATKPTQVGAINDWAARIDGPRTVAFGAMHPLCKDPAREISRIAELGLRGFKMHPEHQEFEPHDSNLDPIWRAAIENRMVVLFHAGEDVIHPTLRGTAKSFARLIDAWPELTAVLAHMGGFQQWDAVTRYLAGSNLWLDTAYALGHLPDDEFVALVRTHGPDRILFGSDGPWTNPSTEIAHLRRLELSPSQIAGILGGNASALLGLT